MEQEKIKISNLLYNTQQSHAQVIPKSEKVGQDDLKPFTIQDKYLAPLDLNRNNEPQLIKSLSHLENPQNQENQIPLNKSNTCHQDENIIVSKDENKMGENNLNVKQNEQKGKKIIKKFDGNDSMLQIKNKIYVQSQRQNGVVLDKIQSSKIRIRMNEIEEGTHFLKQSNQTNQTEASLLLDNRAKKKYYEKSTCEIKIERETDRIDENKCIQLSQNTLGLNKQLPQRIKIINEQINSPKKTFQNSNIFDEYFGNNINNRFRSLILYGKALNDINNIFNMKDADSLLVSCTHLQLLLNKCERFIDVINQENCLLDISKIFSNKKQRKTIRQSMILERIVIVFISQNLQDKDAFIKNFKYLKGIVSYVFQNFNSLLMIIHEIQAKQHLHFLNQNISNNRYSDTNLQMEGKDNQRLNNDSVQKERDVKQKENHSKQRESQEQEEDKQGLKHSKQRESQEQEENKQGLNLSKQRESSEEDKQKLNHSKQREPQEQEEDKHKFNHSQQKESQEEDKQRLSHSKQKESSEEEDQQSLNHSQQKESQEEEDKQRLNHSNQKESQEEDNQKLNHSNQRESQEEDHQRLNHSNQRESQEEGEEEVKKILNHSNQLESQEGEQDKQRFNFQKQNESQEQEDKQRLNQQKQSESQEEEEKKRLNYSKQREQQEGYVKQRLNHYKQRESSQGKQRLNQYKQRESQYCIKKQGESKQRLNHSKLRELQMDVQNEGDIKLRLNHSKLRESQDSIDVEGDIKQRQHHPKLRETQEGVQKEGYIKQRLNHLKLRDPYDFDITVKKEDELVNSINHNNQICVCLYKKVSRNDNEFMTYVFQFFKSMQRVSKVNECVNLYLTQRQQTKNQTNLPFQPITFLQTAPSPYLPPLENKFKYTLVLDLDETLIHFHTTHDSTQQFSLRPYVHTFLQQLSLLYEVIIFTSSMHFYADWIIDTFDKHHYIRHRLYRYNQFSMISCCISQIIIHNQFFFQSLQQRQHMIQLDNVYIKDLSRIGRDLSKVIIVDNVSDNFKLQPKNGILIKRWKGDHKDTSLIKLLPILKQIVLNASPDVRVALNDFKKQIKTKQKTQLN